MTCAREYATTIVSEFIYCLDNLPNEVAYLLQEIKEKDSEIKVQGTRRLSVMRASLNQITLDLQAEIDRDSSRYIHHSLNVSDSASSSTSLSAEKCALAQRIIELVRALRGEPLEPAFAARPRPQAAAPHASRARPRRWAPRCWRARSTSARRATPASQIRESLHTALGASTTMPDIQTQPPSATPVAAFALVRRRRRSQLSRQIHIYTISKN
ncbi:hypothetical protein B0H14DRAFT_2692392 [Mycena olivaceomarginata]|nr:hypothetical protein B0H14DRAFT_2692392 [Mycena olivaceomarginata]